MSKNFIKSGEEKFYHIDLNQRTPEWFELRKGRITGSEFPKLFINGETRELLIRRLALSRVGSCFEFKADGISEHMKRGMEMEPLAREAYKFLSKNAVLEVGFAEYCRGEMKEIAPFVGCSPDGLVGLEGIIEIKCPAEYNFEKQKEIPEKYRRQMAFNVFVTNRKWCDYVLFNQYIGTHIERYEPSATELGEVSSALLMAVDEIKKLMKQRESLEIPF